MGSIDAQKTYNANLSVIRSLRSKKHLTNDELALLTWCSEKNIAADIAELRKCDHQRVTLNQNPWEVGLPSENLTNAFILVSLDALDYAEYSTFTTESRPVEQLVIFLEEIGITSSSLFSS